MLSLRFSEELIPVPRPSLVITSQKIHYKSATLLGITGEMPIILLSVWKFRIVCPRTPCLQGCMHGLQLLEKSYCVRWNLTISKTIMQCVFENARKDRAIKIIFYFLRGHTDSKCEVIITVKRANLGDNKGIKACKCLVNFSLSERTNAYAY